MIFLSSLDSKTQWVEASVMIQSPVRVEASVMIFSKFPSSSDSKFSSTHVFPLLTHQTQSPVMVEASIIIFANFPSSVSDFPFLVGNSNKFSSGQFGGERFGLNPFAPENVDLRTFFIQKMSPNFRKT